MIAASVAWLKHSHPLLAEVRLADCNMRTLDPDAPTEAQTRVLLEAARGEESWSTNAVSRNVIEAGSEGLAASLELRTRRAGVGTPQAAEGARP